MRRISSSRILPYVFFLALAATVLWQLLLPGYVLTLDRAFTPNGMVSFEEGTTTYPDNGLPFRVLVDALSRVIPAWLVQKLILLSTLTLAGISAYRLAPKSTGWGRYFAGILYMINPLTYARFMAGYRGFLLGYALVPFGVRAFLDFLEHRDSKAALRVLFWTTLIGIFSLHNLVLVLSAYGVLFTIAVFRAKARRAVARKLLTTALYLSVAYAFVNMYWILPFAAEQPQVLQSIGVNDLRVFAPKVGEIPPLFALASLHGFWRDGYMYAKDMLPFWRITFLFILFLAVCGLLRQSKDSLAVGISFLGLLALVFATGISGPFAPVYEALFNNSLVLRGFRDSQQFLTLVIVAYTYLGALGVEFLSEMSSRLPAWRGKLASISLIVLAVATPLVYSFTMFNFYNQIESVYYPRDWHEADALLGADADDFNVLFLPWHMYMDFSWVPNADRRIVNPARSFFSKPIIQGENIEIGDIRSEPRNPGQAYVESALAWRGVQDGFGDSLVPLNVKYVILAKDADYESYSFLYQQEDLDVVFEAEHIVVFRNVQPVARLYQTDDLSSFYPIKYREEPAPGFPKYVVLEEPERRYVAFVPPNLDAAHWQLNGSQAMADGPMAVFEGTAGTIAYAGFSAFMLGRTLSSVAVAIIGLALAIGPARRWMRGFPSGAPR